MSVVLITIVPVFSVIAVGYALAARRGLHLPTLADLALLVTSPALVFSLLAGTAIDPRQWSALVGGTVWIAAGTGLLGLLYLRAGAGGRRGLLLPSVFWNAGNMGLACARLAFGPEGLAAAAIVFVTMSVLTSIFGIWIAKGENGLREVLRLPLAYAGVGGVALALTETTLPRIVMEPIEMLGAMAIPLMLLNLGIQLRTLKVTDLAHSLVAVGIRMGGGVTLALLFVTCFGVGGVDRQVLLLSSVMPAAVINVVLAQRYATDPGLVASSIVLGTLLSLLSIPAVLLIAA
jgi:predicted permease